DSMITAVDFAARQDAALATADALGLGLLAICSPGSCLGISGSAQGYMRFLSGWDAYETPSLLVLRRGSRPWLLVTSPTVAKMAAQSLAGMDIEWADPDRFAAAILPRLRDGAPKRIGLCGWEEMPAGLWPSVAAGLEDIECVPVADALARLRFVKDAAQREILTEGAAICDAMFARLQRTPVVGRSGFDIKSEVEQVAREAGCERVNSWLTVGRGIDYSRYFHPETQQVAQRGDLLMYGMQLVCRGMWCHAVRTWQVGALDDRRAALQDMAVSLQRQVVEEMRPGADLRRIVRDAYGRARSVVEAAGSDDVTIMRLGHGLGYSYAEPLVTDAFPRSFYDPATDAAGGAPILLEEGMVFEIHPMFMFAEGGAGVGDMVIVGKDGGTFMTASPRALGLLQG
ncbi:MAG: M24 family metallopeptidase, partial [Acetobacterales bacterium]